MRPKRVEGDSEDASSNTLKRQKLIRGRGSRVVSSPLSTESTVEDSSSSSVEPATSAGNDVILPEVSVDLRESIKTKLRARFSLAYNFMLSDPAVHNSPNCSISSADTVVTLCRALRQPYSVVLTALVYLQLYKNASDHWKSHYRSQDIIVTHPKSCPSNGAIIDNDGHPVTDPGSHEHFLVAAACVLLAWKYREDDTRVTKSTGKIFEFTSVIYKLYVAQTSSGGNIPSVSGWMLRDTGQEITRLKTQLLEHEAHLLHALNYHVGPIPIPHKLIPAYVRKFLIALCPDFSEIQELCQQFEHYVCLLVLDCYKTRICIEYSPGEILVSCIFKTACLLSESGAYDLPMFGDGTNFFDAATTLDARLRGFISSLGQVEISAKQVVRCMFDIRLLVHSDSDKHD
ncbi:uncharacterized protein BBOV_IV008680 [Babesia bovis T2Bo]|uniref:Cyclin N-terminal domain-containing protein n=1 Tax=Babesia bovis TaxID=5865 RepID=A7ARQ3_BABBO|nr:uncharacterized protein BBOV_IV008680 [Babesia bovis T2Bo]EDO07222.1 hypothetical protein BBOV_IV008680 [Babesia bovis T2Bo]|eukprot:XP_001610790.1 hypothetical protein [Babesia bovis T2Bo]